MSEVVARLFKATGLPANTEVNDSINTRVIHRNGLRRVT